MMISDIEGFVAGPINPHFDNFPFGFRTRESIRSVRDIAFGNDKPDGKIVEEAITFWSMIPHYLE
jgi:hypothetical protein